jgi:hypothetical protein
MHGDAGLDQLARDVGLQVGKAEDEVRPDGEDLVQVAAGEGEDLGLFLACAGWTHGVAADADDAMLLAEGVEDLDGFRRQADDALRQAGHAQRSRFARAVSRCWQMISVPSRKRGVWRWISAGGTK